jgi:hypothetical protein
MNPRSSLKITKIRDTKKEGQCSSKTSNRESEETKPGEGLLSYQEQGASIRSQSNKRKGTISNELGTNQQSRKQGDPNGLRKGFIFLSRSTINTDTFA